jgi:hypothetical protein
MSMKTLFHQPSILFKVLLSFITIVLMGDHDSDLMIGKHMPQIMNKGIKSGT